MWIAYQSDLEQVRPFTVISSHSVEIADYAYGARGDHIQELCERIFTGPHLVPVRCELLLHPREGLSSLLSQMAWKFDQFLFEILCSADLRVNNNLLSQSPGFAIFLISGS